MKIEPQDLIGNDVNSAWESGQPTLGLIKETLETKRGITIPDDVFRYAVEHAVDKGLITFEGSSTDDFYNTLVRQPSWLKLTESQLTEFEIQDLAEQLLVWLK